MTPHSATVVLSLSLSLALPSLSQTIVKAESKHSTVEKGVVVEKVTKKAEAGKAGMRVGDILLSWRQHGAHGEIESPFDLPRIETELASRGVVRFEGMRGHVKHIWFLHAYGWELWVRPNIKGEVLNTYEEGRQLAKAGNMTAAVERWQNAAEIARQLNVSWLPSWMLVRAAQWLMWVGQSGTAFQFYEEAVRQASDSGPVVRADLLWQWASSLEYIGHTAEAEQRYKEVLSEWETLGPETVAAAASLIDLGRLNLKKGDLAQAEECFNRILSMSKSLPRDNVQIALSFINLGFIFEGRGDLAKAERYYRRAQAIERTRSPQSSRLALALTNLAALAYQRGNSAGSEQLYRQALAVAAKSSPGSLDEANVIEGLAECVAERGRLLEAEGLQRRALAIRKKASPESLDVASSLAGLGRTARLRSNLETAEEYYGRALTIAKKFNPAPLELSNILIGAGNVFRTKRDVVNAESCYREALAIMEKLAPHSANHTDTLAALAGLMHQQGNVEESAGLYEQALGEIERQTAHLGGIEDDDFLFRASYEDTYKDYVSLLLEENQPERAFEVIETSRARSLLEVLSRSHIDVRQGVDPALFTRQRRLQQLINAKSEYQLRLLQSKHTDEEAATLNTEIDNLLVEYQGVQAEIRTSSPNYVALTQPRRWKLSEIQGLLDENTILLEYCLARDRSYVWLVAKNSIAAYELPKRAEIEAVVREVYRLINERSIILAQETDLERELRWRKIDAKYERAGGQLSRMILGPVAAKLGQKRLLIVSDGALQYIPLGALPAPELESRSSTGKSVRERIAPLIVEHEIVGLPSASVLAELRQKEPGRTRPPGAVAVLADPVFNERDSRVGQSEARDSRAPGAAALKTPGNQIASLASARLTRSLAEISHGNGQQLHLVRLPATREEAEAIFAVTPTGKLLRALDFDASRTTAMNPTLAQYKIVHIATHGLLNSRHPELSGLVLSLVNREGRPQNGFLQLQDIYNLHLPVDMVVLSGCQTGLGKEISGEGLIGLTRGFMHAGAQSVVASLWSVSDKATAELMMRFYTALEKNGLPPAAALRNAQIEMWKQSMWTSPYYWAAFEFQGDWHLPQSTRLAD